MYGRILEFLSHTYNHTVLSIPPIECRFSKKIDNFLFNFYQITSLCKVMKWIFKKCWFYPSSIEIFVQQIISIHTYIYIVYTICTFFFRYFFPLLLIFKKNLYHCIFRKMTVDSLSNTIKFAWWILTRASGILPEM